jgi:hypothetical protein
MGSALLRAKGGAPWPLSLWLRYSGRSLTWLLLRTTWGSAHDGRDEMTAPPGQAIAGDRRRGSLGTVDA